MTRVYSTTHQPQVGVARSRLTRRALVAAVIAAAASMPRWSAPMASALEQWQPPTAPSTTAQAVYVYDATAGVPLLVLEADVPRPPASLTKVATALVAMNLLDLNAMVTIDPSDLASMEESRVGLIAGDVLSVRDLLAGMLIASGNDASKAIARFTGGTVLGAAPGAEVSAFVDAMNAMAADLGLSQTHFDNPSGLDSDGQYSSPRDLAMLTVEAMRNPVFAEIVGTISEVLPSTVPPGGYPIHTTNDFLLDGYALGVKTGTTDLAGGCLITATITGGNLLITVVLGSELTTDEFGTHSSARFDDTRRVIDAVAQSYAWVDPSLPGTFPTLDAELAAWQVALPPTGLIPVPIDAMDDAFRVRLSGDAGDLVVMAGDQVLTTRPLKGIA